MARKTKAEKLQYTITHLVNRMTEDLVDRRKSIAAALAASPNRVGTEWHDENTALLRAIDDIIRRRELAR
jgi:hypothetical protein